MTKPKYNTKPFYSPFFKKEIKPFLKKLYNAEKFYLDFTEGDYYIMNEKKKLLSSLIVMFFETYDKRNENLQAHFDHLEIIIDDESIKLPRCLYNFIMPKFEQIEKSIDEGQKLAEAEARDPYSFYGVDRPSV